MDTVGVWKLYMQQQENIEERRGEERRLGAYDMYILKTVTRNTCLTFYF